jgi:hypothetical protein
MKVDRKRPHISKTIPECPTNGQVHTTHLPFTSESILNSYASRLKLGHGGDGISEIPRPTD